MKVKSSDLSYNFILLTIAIGLFLNNAQIAVAIVMFVMLFLALTVRKEVGFSKWSLIIFAFCFFILGLGWYIKGPSMAYTVLRFVFLFSLYVLVQNKYLEKEHSTGDWFYYLMLFLMILSVFMSIYYKSSYSGNFYFGMNRDKNYSAIIVFLFFMYSNKRGKLGGILFAFIYALTLNDSRSYLLLLILFYVVMWLQNPIYKIINKTKLNRMFVVFTVLFIIMVFFTIFWVFNVSVSNVSTYHKSLIDMANQERFVGNYRGLEMLQRDKSIRIWGYGSNYNSVLGLDEYVMYRGVRLQPVHNSLFNPLIRMGILVGLIYLFVVSKLIDHYYVKENLSYIIPFVINAMFVHSMFENLWLVFWVVILSLDKRTYNFGVLKFKLMNGKIAKKDSM
ncbi:MAG: hypothetical protein ACI4FX_00905 [Agathobacter sp.]